MGFLAIVIAIVGSSYSINSQKEAKNNDIRVAKAKEIAEDSDIFEIDKDSLDTDMYIDYVFKFQQENSTDLIEIDGIYIGKLENGIPHGFGVFYYEIERTDDESKTWEGRMFSGEWEKGNLKSATEVEIRCIYRKETNKGNSVGKYCLKNEWRYGWFINDEFEGMFNAISDGDTDTLEVSFIGNLEINRAVLTREIEVGLSEELSSEDLNLIEGKMYYSAGGLEVIFDGEFRDNEPYNGTAQGSDDGESFDYHVKNGEIVD